MPNQRSDIGTQEITLKLQHRPKVQPIATLEGVRDVLNQGLKTSFASRWITRQSRVFVD